LIILIYPFITKWDIVGVAMCLTVVELISFPVSLIFLYKALR
jgi:hypothetical protein